jgi:putative glutathione S-transferase
MGFLINGKWDAVWYDNDENNGEFQRKESLFRSWIIAPTDAKNNTEFVAEANRYHLYVSLACPWAHRALIMRKLKGLEETISISVVNSFMSDAEGWTFDTGRGVIEDSINHKQFLHEIYLLSDPSFTGVVSVPLLWDKKLNKAVNNESSEIIRMFNSAFNTLNINGQSFVEKKLDFYPEHLRKNIDKINLSIYQNINNGVYRVGFASQQKPYEKALIALFKKLDELEMLLSKQRYLVGETFTEADIRLFTTLIRFDAVYYGHFKCNLKRISDFPNLFNYMLDILQTFDLYDTIDLEYTKAHYYGSHDKLNPSLIVPLGPIQDFRQPHNRHAM